MSFCEGCFEKQRKIDALTAELDSLKAKLRYRQRKAQEGFFGASTPSSQLPVKANTVKQPKPGGAQPGHAGHGRRGVEQSEADRIVSVRAELGECPQCGDPLQELGAATRSVIDLAPMRVQRVLYRLPRKYCRRCRRTFQPPTPGVLPKSLYSNQVLATAATMHYLHGIPMGRICEQLGIGLGPLIKAFHRLAMLFAKVLPRLMEPYRQCPVKHADETSWRNDGQNGYAWLFATNTISIFLFRKSRSAAVVREVLDTKPLPGTLVVDRYQAYNKVPCAIQYCYAHLLRDVQDLEKEFPEDEEVKAFVGTLAPLLAKAMGLRSWPISEPEFYQEAAQLKSLIQAAVEAPARHLGIRRIQDIFSQNSHRLYHWAEDRNIPAENNLSERDLRPTVIARKVSFGSQSDAGARTRSVLMTILHTLKKQTADPCSRLKTTLDRLAQQSSADPFEILFPDAPYDTS